jgi:multidrug resistance efflux pump
MNEQIEELKRRVQVAKEQLEEAEANLIVAESLPESNFFANLAVAEYKLYHKLKQQANRDCEGAGECGLEQYTQLFYVDKTLYKAVANVEYNRHDKTYYYVDGFDFKIEGVQ